ncbi:MAG: iron ABC transporter permease [Pseudomonadota bacterium]
MSATPPPHRRLRLNPRYGNGWLWLTVVLCLPIALPAGNVLLGLLSTNAQGWSHLTTSVLPTYLVNTLTLLLSVGLLSLLLGVPTAWLVAHREFPGRRLLRWALVLPLAAPGYVVAYVYADLFEAGDLFAGWPVGSIRSLPGAAVVLALTLYPYIYLLTLNSFEQQTASFTAVARSLGLGEWRRALRISLPLSRAAIAGGLALVLMETAADYGVVEFYGVPTLTNGIFRTWFAMGDAQTATQLAGLLFLVALTLIVLEQVSRRGRTSNPVRSTIPLVRTQGGPVFQLLAPMLCFIPCVFGFIVPVAALSWYTFTVGDPLPAPRFAELVGNTALVATLTAAVACVAALLLAYAQRQRPGPTLNGVVRFATLGYALPGMVLAIGVLAPLTALDRQLAAVWSTLTAQPGRLLLTGTVTTLLLVYAARFLTAAFNSLSGALSGIAPDLDAASRSLGMSHRATVWRVHLPLLAPALGSAALLVFIDVVKELPATLVLRPFNFETLATRTYRLAADERLREASTAALIIVSLGLLPALLLGRERHPASNKN